jgi:hypothetical protein
MLFSEFYSFEIFELATVRQVIVILHLVGLALGAGAAFFSDFLFTHSLKDRKFTTDEFVIIKLASKVVWLGLGLLLLSGILLFLSNYEGYLDSTKFLSKMTIIWLLALNGVIFHIKHIPLIGQVVDKDITKEKDFIESSRSFFVSGAISGVSWMAALVLGSLNSVPLGYLTIMAIYGLVLVPASMAGLYLHKYFTTSKN